MVCYHLFPHFLQHRKSRRLINCIYLDKSSFIDTFKHQISHFTVTIHEDGPAEYSSKSSTNVFTSIFTMFMNLIYLRFGLNGDSLCSPRSLSNFLSPTCYPSNIVYLTVRVHRFNDCLYLLDGHLSQLHTFLVEVDDIYDTSVTINTTVKHFPNKFDFIRESQNKIYWKN
jgi:hypothetical protein